MFKLLLPSDLILHFDTSKKLLENRIFTNNAILFTTKYDFYLTSDLALKSAEKLIANICNKIKEKDYYQE